MDTGTVPSLGDNLVTTSSHDNEEEAAEVAVERPAQDEEARSKATFEFKVENFSTIKDPVWSPPCIVSNLPWRIIVRQKQVYHSD